MVISPTGRIMSTSMKPKINWGEIILNLIKTLGSFLSKVPTPKPQSSTQEPKPAPVVEVNLPIVPSAPENTGFLGCPIQAMDGNGKPVTAFTAKISAVIDHSDTAIDPTSSKNWGVRAKDQTVKAFNGEVGDGEASDGPPFGYAKKTPGQFFANGELNYVGAGGNGQVHPNSWYLQYDGHAGYDFPYPRMTPILATADGELSKATDIEDTVYVAGWGKNHTFYIKHKNGFASWYRHCVKLKDEIEAQIGSDYTKSVPVQKGDVVAYVGNFGFPAIHLHFEVHDSNGKIVDPYGDELWA